MENLLKNIKTEDLLTEYDLDLFTCSRLGDGKDSIEEYNRLCKLGYFKKTKKGYIFTKKGKVLKMALNQPTTELELYRMGFWYHAGTKELVRYSPNKNRHSKISLYEVGCPRDFISKFENRVEIQNENINIEKGRQQVFAEIQSFVAKFLPKKITPLEFQSQENAW